MGTGLWVASGRMLQVSIAPPPLVTTNGCIDARSLSRLAMGLNAFAPSGLHTGLCLRLLTHQFCQSPSAAETVSGLMLFGYRSARFGF